MVAAGRRKLAIRQTGKPHDFVAGDALLKAPSSRRKDAGPDGEVMFFAGLTLCLLIAQ